MMQFRSLFWSNCGWNNFLKSCLPMTVRSANSAQCLWYFFLIWKQRFKQSIHDCTKMCLCIATKRWFESQKCYTDPFFDYTKLWTKIKDNALKKSTIQYSRIKLAGKIFHSFRYDLSWKCRRAILKYYTLNYYTLTKQ